MRLRSPLRRYHDILTEQRLRVLFPGLAVSYIGDGVSMVAVPWLAVRLAPPDRAGLWVGLALAAYTLPGAAGGFLLAPLVRRLSTVRIAEAAAWVRAVPLGIVVCLAAQGLLTPPLYIALLAASSVLYTWGVSAQYTLVAAILPEEQRLAANSLFSSLANFGIIVGAAVSGVVTASIGPLVALGADAVTFVVLAAAYRFGVARRYRAPTRARRRGLGTGLRSIRQSRLLFAMIGITFAYYLLAGPIQAALPLFVAQDLDASSRLLGTMWAVSGCGAVAGALVFGLVRNPPLWLMVVLVIVGSSLMSLLLGSATAVLVCVLGFSLSRLAFSPYPALSYTLIQQHAPPAILSEVLVARGALIVVAPPLGTALGGPIVDALGPRPTVLLSAGSTLTLGLGVGVVLLLRRARPGTGRGGRGPVDPTSSLALPRH